MGAARQEAPALKIENVSIRFGDFKAIKNVSTSVGKNEARFFIGPNGAGKTTILDAICGKNHVSEGKIYFSAIRETGCFQNEGICYFRSGNRQKIPGSQCFHRNYH